MNTAMEMHDSVVLQVESSADGSGFILFRAVIFRSPLRPAIDPGEGGWQNVRMTFKDMRVEGTIPNDEPYAADGYLSVDRISDDGLIPFPANHLGEILLSMVLSDKFETTNIRASSVSILAEGEFEFESNCP
jgi:hypothetical protein